MRGERHASRRAVLTTIDQALSSISNFAVGVAVARVAGQDALGTFSVAYALWLAAASLHRAVIAEPMAIEGDVRTSRDRVGAQQGLAAELLLGAAAAVCVAAAGVTLFLAGSGGYGAALLALAPWLPVLLVQDYWRWVGFMEAEPERSLANDGVFAGVQTIAFGVILAGGFDSTPLVIGAWGAGALAGALWGLRQFEVTPALGGGWQLLVERWRLSKWLMAHAVTTWLQSHAYVFIVGAMMGPAVLGGLRAAQTLVQGPSMVLIQAGGSIGLPEASKAYAERGWPGLRRVSALVTGAGFAALALVAGIVVVAGERLLRVVYGPEFGSYASAASLFALAYVAMAFGLGSILVLKAARRTAYLFHVSVLQLAFSVATVVVLTAIVGANGAPLATLVTMIISTAALIHYRRHTVAAMRPMDAYAGSDGGAPDGVR